MVAGRTGDGEQDRVQSGLRDGSLKSCSEMGPGRKAFKRFIEEKYPSYAKAHEQNLQAIDLAKNKHDEARTRGIA